MLSKNNILIISGTLVLAFLLLRKKGTKKVATVGEKKVIAFDPIDIQPMPWVATPNYFKEVK